ncbi:MAG: arsenate reductase ArsC [Pseudomonadota bacterium]
MPNTLSLMFVCTHNRCRSILCEALARSLSEGRITATSAGSSPSGEVHPDTLATLQALGIDTTGLRSKSWDHCDGKHLDAVITVCDSAAGESCPLWLSNTVIAHWGLPDPSKVEGASARAAAFDAVIGVIERRVRRLLAHDFAVLEGERLRDALEGIAKTPT